MGLQHRTSRKGAKHTAITLSQDQKNFKLINRVATLERMLFELRSNQVKKINWAGLQVDGTGSAGVITGANGPLLGVKGIDSLNNFSHSQLTNFSTQTTTSTSFATVPGATMAPLTLTESAYVLIYLLIGGSSNGIGSAASYLAVNYRDGVSVLQDLGVFGVWETVTTQDPGTLVVTSTYDHYTQFASFMQFVQLAAGTHTFSLQMAISNSGDTGYLDDYIMGYIVFGS